MTATLVDLRIAVEANVGCHNDFNPWNVICGADGWVLVDWETAADNHPLYDLVTMAEGLEWDESRRARLVECYFETVNRRSPSADDVRTFTQLFRLGEYAWAFAERARGNEREELDGQLERSLMALQAS